MKLKKYPKDNSFDEYIANCDAIKRANEIRQNRINRHVLLKTIKKKEIG